MYNKSFRRPNADRFSTNESEKDAENNTTSSSGLHIAPLPPFKTTSTPTVLNNNNNNNNNSSSNDASTIRQQKERVKSVKGVKSEESKIKAKKSSEPSTNDFDSMFSTEKNTFEQSDFANKHGHSKIKTNNTKDDDSSGIDSFFHELTANKTVDENFTNANYFVDAKSQIAPSPKSDNKVSDHIDSKKGKEKIHVDDEEDEHIDWASSEDEEAVQKEIESFEKNKVSEHIFYL
jgi:hypothetical protein